MISATEMGIETWKDLLKKSRMLVFDFDGTLVDSVPIKWRAFDRCFEKFSAHREQISAYCRGNNHTPRWEKFRHVYEHILGLPYTPDVEQGLNLRFEQETTEQISQAPSLPGAAEFLRQICPNYRIALLSSTPHEILMTILQKRGWASWFDEVQGAPVNKASWLMGLRKRGLAPGQILFFGDTPEDAAAAREAGCGFVSVPEMGDFRKLLGTT